MAVARYVSRRFRAVLAPYQTITAQHYWPGDVRLGSLASFRVLPVDVRSSPESDRNGDLPAKPDRH